MDTRFKQFRFAATALVVAAASLFFGHVGVGAQTTQYERLSVAQKRLVEELSTRMNSERRRKKPANVLFAELPVSERATFAAVSNALANTELTDSSGGSLGLAIELVQSIEMIAGERPGKRSDQQYRLYVTLRGDAASILEKAREFKRGRDNTRFHKGYPTNYRQIGSAPTLQFSLSKDGGRADIDVDYRSSSFPAGLFNGHLTSDNSDIRAPGNYFTHVLRWPGLIDDWRANLSEAFEEYARTKLKPLDPRFVNSTKTSASDLQMIKLSADHFLRLWIERRDPDRAANFVGTRFLTCPERGGVKTDPMFEMRLRVLFYNLLKAANKGLGGKARLQGLIEPLERNESWLSESLENQGGHYSIARVAPGGETGFACRGAVRPSTGVPALHYVTSFKFRSKRNDGGVLSLLWAYDAGLWRIQAFDATPGTPD